MTRLIDGILSQSEAWRDFNSCQWLRSVKDNGCFYSTLSLDKGSDENLNDLNKIHQRKTENLKAIVLEHLSINSLRNKFVFVQVIIRDFDIFIISGSKLHKTFPNNQFKTDFQKMFRLDRNRYRGGIFPLHQWKKCHVKYWLVIQYH